MIIWFYGLYVAITPANWSWLWFSIALIMTIWQWLRRPAVEDAINKALEHIEDQSNNHLGGPFA